MNNQLEQKFEELFTDECIEKQYAEWHEKKVKERDKRTRFEKTIPFIVMVTMFSAFMFLLWFMKRDRVDQEVYKQSDGKLVFATWVWYDDKIVQSFYSDVPSITDSIKSAHRIAGEKLLQTLKK
jgi:hypothetical protein